MEQEMTCFFKSNNNDEVMQHWNATLKEIFYLKLFIGKKYFTVYMRKRYFPILYEKHLMLYEQREKSFFWYCDLVSKDAYFLYMVYCKLQF